MHVDPAEAATHEAMCHDEAQDFVVARRRNLRHCREQRQKLVAVGQTAARQFTDDERMSRNLHGFQELHKGRILLAQVVYPYRRINQHAFYRPAVRLRGMAFRLLSVPPNAARRRALSRAMSATRPACKTSVFLVKPLNLRACSSSVSSIINVVLICINMPEWCISVKIRNQIWSPKNIGTAGKIATQHSANTMASACGPSNYRDRYAECDVGARNASFYGRVMHLCGPGPRASSGLFESG